jgi:hypothetical protein
LNEEVDVLEEFAKLQNMLSRVLEVELEEKNALCLACMPDRSEEYQRAFAAGSTLSYAFVAQIMYRIAHDGMCLDDAVMTAAEDIQGGLLGDPVH